MKMLYGLKLTILLLFVQSSYWLYAQTEIENHQAYNYLLIAEDFEEEGKIHEAITYIHKAANVYDSVGLYTEKFDAMAKIAALHNVLGEFGQVINVADQMIEDAERIGEKHINYSKGLAYTLKGASLARQGQLEDALNDLLTGNGFLKQFADTTHYEKLAYNNNAIGITYYFMYAYDSAIFYYNRAMEKNKLILGPEHPNISAHYNNIGVVYNEMGLFSLGLEFCIKAASIKEKSFGKTHYSLANTYENMGLSYMNLGKYEKAIELHTQALRIREGTFGKDHFETAGSHNNIGIVYNELGNFNEAKKHFEHVIKTTRVVFDNHHPYFVQAHENIGTMYLYQKKFDKALSCFNKIYNTYDSIHYAPGASRILIKMGALYDAKGEPGRALEYYQKAICFNSFDFKDTSIYAIPQIKELELNNFTLGLLGHKSRLLEKLSASSSKTTNLKASLRVAQLSDSLISVFSYRINRSKDQLEKSSASSKIYDHLVRVSHKLNRITHDSNYLNMMFSYSEKNRASILTKSISESKAKHFVNIPDEILNLQEYFKTKISFYKSQLTSERSNGNNGDSSKIPTYENKLFDLNQKNDSIVQIFERDFPKYYQLKYDKKTASIESIQNRLLQPNQTLIEYFVGDSSIYSFMIEKDNFEVKKLRLHDSLYQYITNLPKFLENEDLANYSHVAYELHQQLIKPLELKNNNLIVIPDGILWHLNFDILLSEKPVKTDFKSLEYLIKNNNISYAYSATLLLQGLEPGMANKPESECLAFSYGNPSDSIGGNSLAMRSFRTTERQSLPGTKKEVQAIANILEGDYYFGSYANEKNFKKNAKNYSVLHLALHGEIDDMNPMNSKLIFSQNKDSIEDNYLHAFELYNTELNADLAVLSACNTGGGKIQKGEGIMSLGSAFSYAGCKSLLISQWELSDATTPEIIKDFYKNLQDGQSKSSALRHAKLSYLEKSDQPSANPYYWASMIQLGNDEPIYSYNNRLWVGILISLMLIGIIWLAYGRKQS